MLPENDDDKVLSLKLHGEEHFKVKKRQFHLITKYLAVINYHFFKTDMRERTFSIHIIIQD